MSGALRWMAWLGGGGGAVMAWGFAEASGRGAGFAPVVLEATLGPARFGGSAVSAARSPSIAAAPGGSGGELAWLAGGAASICGPPEDLSPVGVARTPPLTG